MTNTRVEIGKLIVRGGKFSSAEGISLGRRVEGHLSQMLTHGGSPQSRQAQVVQIRAGRRPARSDVAETVARTLYRSIRGKG
jgi:hypothetical protein